ncbi:MAG: DUF1957 domain-containing protein [Planctomycetes bacterium]|nr:DUF1957 domain-containing protein [Planctomycetota bacterium]
MKHTDDGLHGHAGVDYGLVKSMDYSLNPGAEPEKEEPEAAAEAEAPAPEPGDVCALPETFTDQDTGETVQIDRQMLLQEPFIDEYYNETYAYLIPREPGKILAIWEVGEGTRKQLREKFGEDFFNKNRLIMRVYEVTGVDFNGFNANSVFEVDDYLNDKNSYWLTVGKGCDFIMEIGYRSEGTDYFELVARSNSVFSPKGFTEKQERYNEYVSIDVDMNSVEIPVGEKDWRWNQYKYWRERSHSAPEEKGYWALVLHQHLPFVRHPEYDVPLEEQWYMEAVVNVYTQLIHMFWNLSNDKVDFRVTLSLTPSLMSMMQDDLLKERVARHIDQLIELATRERDNSVGRPYHDTVEQTLHRFWVAKEVFDAYDGDLTRAYKDFQDMGKIEVITCPATHMVLPLFKHFPEAVRSQIRTAVHQYERVLGRKPRGMWLPENAYTPGIDKFLAEEGIKWCLVNFNGLDEGDTRNHLGTNAPIITPNGVAVFGIDQMTRSAVWSRESGYPGHPNYKEWYRDLGYEADWDYLPEYFKTANVRRNTGLKYYRITAKNADLGAKDYYHPDWAQGTVHEQAGQFVCHRGAQAYHTLQSTGKKPCIVSAYDAELFGHWWEEGPAWLESVFRKMLFDQSEVRPVTPSEYLGEHPTHQKMVPGASSWGKKDYFQTWVEEREYQPNHWIFRHLYRMCNHAIDCATKFKDIDMATEKDPQRRVLGRALNQMVRELFLAISSDWGFLISTGQAVRYSEVRTIKHIDRSKELIRQIEEGKINLGYLCTLEMADNIFNQDMDFRTLCRE